MGAGFSDKRDGWSKDEHFNCLAAAANQPKGSFTMLQAA